MKGELCVLLLSGILTACASNQHLVFFTNTTIGLEVGSEPSSGTPAKFVLGYKRQEGVIDPLIPNYYFYSSDSKAEVPNTLSKPQNGNTHIVLTPAGVAVPKGSETLPHSVLAKMNFGATGGGTGAAASQWFATGLAAESLAKLPGVTSALSGYPVGSGIDLGLHDHDLSRYAYLVDIYSILKKAAESGDHEAMRIKQKVDALDRGEYRKKFIYYYIDDVNGKKKVNHKAEKFSENKSFKNITTYLSRLDESIRVCRKAILSEELIDTAEEKEAMLAAIVDYSPRLASGREKLSNHESVIEMLHYVNNSLIMTQ
ncbi:hypothetical protein [Vibrio rhizosphaerae]|uniref:hypothetical protein n=1 Tax=Vibrio rhizosphaerae TaxID=398736 RepID=UPI00056EFBAA|nr:hypothetical protein [Vibrio rhizosphaerae]